MLFLGLVQWGIAVRFLEYADNGFCHEDGCVIGV